MKNAAFGIAVCFLMLVQALALIAPGPSIFAGGNDAPPRTDPVLSNGGVTPTTGDPANTTFQFFVTCYDADGDWPDVMVVIDGVGKWMYNQNRTGLNWNCTYSSYDFESGTHYFHFLAQTYYYNSTNTSLRYPASGNLTFTVKPGYHRPQFYNMTISNSQPSVGEVVEFSTWYKDPDGGSFAWAYLFIEEYIELNLSAVGTDFINGVQLKGNWSIPYKDSYRYYFRAVDRTRLIVQTDDMYFWVPDHLPELYDPSLDPPTGDARNTTFVFGIWCRDVDNEHYHPRLIIDDQQDFYMSRMSGNNINGSNFTTSVSLYSGTHRYYYVIWLEVYTNGSYNQTEVRYPVSGFLTMTATGNYNPPLLYDSFVSPLNGTKDTIFTLSIWYKDVNGDPPQFISVDCFGNGSGNDSLKITGTDYKNGVKAEWKSKISTLGRYNPSFRTMDTTGLYAYNYMNETIFVQGQKGLSYLANGTTDRSVTQYYGCMNFYVEYRDMMNQRPIESVLVVNGYYVSNMWYDYFGENSSYFIMGTHWHPYRMDNVTGNSYKYHFEVIDSQYYELRYPATGELTFDVFDQLPQLSYGRVTPDNGSDLQEREFIVGYQDWMGKAPSSIKLYLDGSPYEMIVTKQTNNTNGSEMGGYIGKKKMTLSPGNHSYYFKGVSSEVAYEVYPYSGSYRPFSIFIDGHSELSAAGHNPSRIFTDTEIAFTVTFKDTSNLEPDYVQVFIDNDVFDMSSISTDYASGVNYTYKTKLPAGNHTYFFLMENAHGILRSPEKGHYHKLTVLVPHAPVLLNAAVSPLTGDTGTTFTFSVTYKDKDGEAPEMVLLSIDGTSFTMVGDNSTDYVGGVDLTYSTQLTKGEHSFYFETRDVTGRSARAPATDVLTIAVEGTEGEPPTASIAYTASGMNVTFSGAGSTDPDGEVETYSWVINGRSYSGEQVTVSFAGTGYYKATLTVIDDDGLSGTVSVCFWVFASGDEPSSEAHEVGASVYLDDNDASKVLLNETGFTVTIEEAERDSVSVHIESESSDPKVVVLEISKDLIDLSEDGDMVLKIGGKQVKMASSLQEVLTSNGTDPLYWIIESDGSYKVMLYLPDPSSVDVEITRSSGDQGGLGQSAIIIGTVTVLILVLMAILAFAVLRSRRRGGKDINNVDVDVDSGPPGPSHWSNGLEEDLAPYVGEVLESEGGSPRRDLASMESGLRRHRDRGRLSEGEYSMYRDLLGRMKEE